MASRVSKPVTQPLYIVFKFLQHKARINIWLYEQTETRIEGKLVGFDEFMNVVLDDAEEVDVATSARTPLGRILLKGDNITLMSPAAAADGTASSFAI